jgi:hypothetical protein
VLSRLRRSILLLATVGSLAGMSSAVSSAATLDPPPPGCGDSIQIQKTSLNKQDGQLGFRVVMVDMRRWVGGFGTLDIDTIANRSGLEVTGGDFNAPGGGGVISGQTALFVPGKDTAVNIGVHVKANGIEVCGSGTTISVS